MRLLFMGTPDFAVPVLRALIAAGHEVAGVWTQPARPAGRGMAPRPSPVAQEAGRFAIPVHDPVSLRPQAEQAAIAAPGADAAVVVAYGLLLPQPVLDAPRLGCWNLHASLLPRWRGAAPINRAIMAGDEASGVMVMRMEAGLDTGPVALAHHEPIGPAMTAGELHDRLAEAGAALMVEAMARLARGALPTQPQPQAGVTYAAKIAKDEARLDWSQPADTVRRTINGLSPWPGAWTTWQGERLKLLKATPAEGQGEPGAVLEATGERLVLACGEGALAVLALQRAGRQPQSAGEFLRGSRLQAGDRLGERLGEGPRERPG